MQPPSNRPGLNSTVPLAMAASVLRTAQPVFWPRSSARMALPVGSPAASCYGQRRHGDSSCLAAHGAQTRCASLILPSEGWSWSGWRRGPARITSPPSAPPGALCAPPLDKDHGAGIPPRRPSRDRELQAVVLRSSEHLGHHIRAQAVGLRDIGLGGAIPEP